MFFGGDYNPEQWPEEVQEADVALMREAGVTAVTVGVFAWSHLEPVEGRYEFGWLDRVLDRLHAGGVKVVLATPTASPPPWFTAAHPEALPVTADGVRLTHGSRDTYCVSAPAYREPARSIARELGRRYARHPALAMWHVHNEYGTDCRCDLTAEAFRGWLRERHGTLDALNEAWTTAFWSQRYTDWAQITPPRATQYLPNPAHVLDFRRFLSDEMLGAYREQRDLLRECNPDVPITTNFVQGGWVSVDHARWAESVDVVAVDHYPDSAGIGAEEETAFAGDLARGWGGGSWLLMETAPNVIYTRGRMHAKEPGRLTRHSLGYVARGSAGAMYFQWRQPRGGAELFHSALVPHAGPDSPVFREAVRLGRTLAALAPQLAGLAPPAAEVALTWDAPSWWALQGAGLPSDGIDYLAAVRQAHRALFRSGIMTDFAFPALDGDLSRYRMIVVPHLYLAPPEVAARLRDFVASGGHLVVGHLSGIADACARVGLGGYPAAFRDFLGVRVTEWHPVDPGVPIALDDGTAVSGWTERVETTGAEVVARYAEGVLAGEPAVTRNGTAWYVSAGLDDAGWQRLLRSVAAEAGVAPVLEDLPPQVEAVRRGALVFLLNHGVAEAVVPLPEPGTDAITGNPVGRSAIVEAGGFMVIRTGQAAPV
ncbi:putative beta-galactosidase [Actinoplanes missouriensis 431]|uniref:Beta-galactosidase n=1 Tax=Actinoplanes missouriensis (strain ATCC 14538 / DSM 43046 / CBS 188.64 / JCM 3121 / NBRC 102363 / NCIMB 12654 / NRRL B-3342 / UNCC 431) TaxID=512565 RepID=I0GZN7_ACTM4|nr:beta-galactosidase [Actinoplanes missouriensis]BAL86224.1 putative beta-galactosidase [Actinoplanes missouriensis 431]